MKGDLVPYVLLECVEVDAILPGGLDDADFVYIAKSIDCFVLFNCLLRA